MVIGAKFAKDRLIPARFEAIKYGIEADIAGDEHLIFYGDVNKASRVCALWDGRIVAIRNTVKRRGH